MTMDLHIKGLNAVVTGGSAGIGRAIVATLADEGCNVWFCSRSANHVASTVEAMRGKSGRVHGAVVDVRDAGQVREWIGGIEAIDILVPTVSALSADWQASIDTDLLGTIATVQAALPRLQASRHGAITYVGSKAASFATPGFESYGAVKAALVHYMKSLSRELIGDGIRVNVVSPGDTYSEDGFWDNIKRNAPAVYEATVAANPLGRLGTPDEAARVVAFVSSPAASFLAGANLLVDGGATAHVHG
jgi:3-oxoacyl-[acyl-carrier protein] reductase